MKLIKIFLVLFLFSFLIAKEDVIIPHKEKTAVVSPNKKISSLNLTQVFTASPVIYSTLLLMSIASFVILIYTLLTFRQKDLISKSIIEDIRDYLMREKYDDAVQYCKNSKNVIAYMIGTGLSARHHGTHFMMETIKSAGRSATSHAWHRLSILNDIVVIAPMLGLLGTVIGMFYAFYDINRSIDTLSALFDGLGIAVGTTVAGLLVAILTMCFHSLLKYRMVKVLSLVENHAVTLGNLIKEEKV